MFHQQAHALGDDGAGRLVAADQVDVVGRFPPGRFDQIHGDLLAPLVLVRADDLGPIEHGRLQQSPGLREEVQPLFEGVSTGAEMAAALGRALGHEIRYNDVPPEVYRGFGFPGADDLGNMFQFKRDFNAEFIEALERGRSQRISPAST